jgi:hypothetical protein
MVYLSPIGGVAGQFFDNNGNPLAGGLLYSYLAGTTTSAPTFTSISGNIQQSNPIVLDSSGRVPGEIWLSGGVSYKFVLQTSDGVQIGSWDNISGIDDFTSLQPIIYNATGTGSSTAFSLTSSPKNINTTNVYINGVYQDKNTYSLSTSTITFSQAPPLTAIIEVSYY